MVADQLRVHSHATVQDQSQWLLCSWWPDIQLPSIIHHEIFGELASTQPDQDLFICFACVCLCLTPKGGWDGFCSLHQHCFWGGTRTLWPSCELTRGLQRPQQRSEVSIHAHHKQCAALAHSKGGEHRQLTWNSLYYEKQVFIFQVVTDFTKRKLFIP